ncbi:MAG: hypothetical protein AABY07_04425 [Nanoarchaeota archaeon]
MKQKETAEILFRILPIPQKQLEELYKKGRLKEKIEKLAPLLRRSYAKVFHSDSDRNDKHLLDDILKEINSSLDNIDNIDESSYFSLINEIKNFELSMSISPETQQELETTTNALEELVIRMERIQKSYRSFIERYVNYLEGLAEKDFKGMTYDEKCKIQIDIRKCIREYKLYNLGE